MKLNFKFEAGLHSKPWENFAKLVVWFLFCWQFVLIVRFAVNVPIWDEWDFAVGFDHPWSLAYFFSPHQSAQIFPTKFLHWFLFRLTEGNFVTEQVVSYFVFGALIVLVTTLLKKSSGRLPPFLIYLSVGFLLSNISWENHSVGFRNQFHFVNLFFLLSVYFLFFSRHWFNLLAASLFAMLTVSSFTSGVAMIFTLVVIYGIFLLLNAKNSWTAFSFFAGSSGLAISIWFVARRGLSVPHAKFWTNWLGVICASFGFDHMPVWFGGLLLILVVAPWLLILKDRRFYFLRTAQTFSLLAVSFGVLAGTAMFAAGTEVPPSLKSAEVGFLLVPLVLVTWYLAVEAYRLPIRLGCLLVAAGVVLTGFSDNWNFRVYQTSFTKKTEEQKCLSDYYNKSGPANCEFLYPGPINDRLETARARGYSWAVEAINKK